MKDFNATLAEFQAGRCESQELEAAFGRLVVTSPAQTDAALAVLDEHHRAGRFPSKLYAALRTAARATELRDDGRTGSSPKPVAAGDAPPSTPATDTFDPLSRDAATAALEPQEAPDVGAGFVLRRRFVLEQEVGRGGMGVVFRARDMRKEEAQDRDPFVAIKILNDKFRRHPESLKALQREARKAQTLAHPNIATVFDFDRDGAIVYIQMEFLRGRPLDVVIRESGGMPHREAYPLIEGIGRALSYAHGAGIVHSDLKPGNCFVTAGDVVKVFDFGIARAAKIQGLPRDEVTRFDAGTLGALTPAYASCEMLDGMQPDPRDDIYALGCVAHELLTGEHPFGMQPATEARAAKLTPPAVKGLTARQQRALQRALAFRRAERTETVAEFLEEFGVDERSKARSIARRIAGGGAVVVAAVVGYALVLSWQARQSDAFVANLSSGDPQRVEPALEASRSLDALEQLNLLQTVREPLLAYFTGLVAAAFDPQQQRYDYAAAEAVLTRAKELFPDSARLAQAERSIVEERAQLTVRMIDELTAHIAAGRVLPSEGRDATDVLEIMRQASPAELPAMEALLFTSYAKNASAALRADDFGQARVLIDLGLARAPNDVSLLDLRDQLAAAVEQRAGMAAAPAAPAAAAQASEAAQRQALAALLAAPTYDTAWETRARDVLAGLVRSLPAGDRTVADSRTAIAQLYVARAAEMRERRRWSEALRLVGVAAGFAPELGTLAAERTAIEAARARLNAEAAEQERVVRVAGVRRKFNAAATANNISQARDAVEELRRLLPADDPFLTSNVPAGLAGIFERLATAARDAGDLNRAEQLALEGLEAAPGNAALTSLVADIRAARARAAQPR